MKFTVTQHDLNNALAFVASAIERKTTLPVMANVMLTAADGRLSLSGSNGEVEKRITIIADVEDWGSITVPAAKFLDFAKNADNSKDITFTVKDNKAIVNSGRSRWSLQTLPSSEFPEFMSIEGAETLSLDISKLIDGISRCAPTMAQQDVRYYLNGMLFDVNGDTMTVVATDGHRMSSYRIDTNASFERQAIIPRKAILDILKMISKASDATIEIGKDNVKVAVGEMVMYTKLVDGKFPDYKRVIPNDFNSSVNLNTEELRNAVKRTLPLSNQYNAMSFDFVDGSLTIESTNAEHENAVEVIPASIEGSDINIGFNGAYVMDMLGSISGEDITFNLASSGSSAKIEEGDFVAVLMPLRL
jgi:DNA polymerase-3 subunit beta